MSMHAKFHGTCRRCGGSFTAGTLIDWSKSTGSMHVTCPSKAAEASPPPPVVDSTAAPFVAREKWAPCKRPTLDAQLASCVGEHRSYTKRGPQRRDGVGLAPSSTDQHGAAGLYVIVGTGRPSYESAEQNEDMGDMSGPGWHVTLYMRAATDEERAQHDHQALGEAIPRIFTALDGMIDRAKERDARAAFEAAAVRPGWGKAEIHSIGSLGPGAADARRDATDLWRSKLERDYSTIVSFAHEGETVLELYHYVYDWDLPRVYAAPLWMLERAQVAQAIVDIGYALQRFVRVSDQRRAA